MRVACESFFQIGDVVNAVGSGRSQLLHGKVSCLCLFCHAVCVACDLGFARETVRQTDGIDRLAGTQRDG